MFLLFLNECYLCKTYFVDYVVEVLKIINGFLFLRVMTYYSGNGKNSSDNYNPSLILLLLSGNLVNMEINGNNDIFCILIISQQYISGIVMDI